MRRLAVALLVATLCAGMIGGPASARPSERERAADAFGVPADRLKPNKIGPAEAEAGMGPLGATAWEAPRRCENWYASADGREYRLGHCTNPYFVQDAVKAHARLHLYERPTPTSSWVTAAPADSLTINEWAIHIAPTFLYEFPHGASAGGSSIRDFYSDPVRPVPCGSNGDNYVVSWNYNESARTYYGTALYGPGGAREIINSELSERPC